MAAANSYAGLRQLRGKVKIAVDVDEMRRHGQTLICVDTTCIIAYLAGDDGSDVEFLDKLLLRKMVVLPPVAVAELFSDPALPREAELLIGSLPVLPLGEGYWGRAGKLRARLAAAGFGVRLADTLIAQVCLHHKTPLLTRDKGFRRFGKVAGLKLL